MLAGELGKSFPEKYILYADDDQDDRALVHDSLSQIDDSLALITVDDGVQLVEFLNDLQPGMHLPCLIIVDLNMPKLDGIQTLKHIKSQEHLREIAVVVFSTSYSQTEVVAAKSHGAADYILKPVSSSQLQDIASKFVNYCHSD